MYKDLINSGYTHIHLQGLIESKEHDENNIGQHPFILVPYNHDPSILFEDAELHVEEINSLQVAEMLEYTPGIDFYIRLGDDPKIMFASKDIKHII